MTAFPPQAPEPQSYPGYTEPEIAAAKLAVIAADLACQERGIVPMAECDVDPTAAALSCIATAMEQGWSPEQARVEVILLNFLSALGEALAREMNATFSGQEKRFITMSLLEWLNERFQEERYEELAEAEPADPSMACWENGAE